MDHKSLPSNRLIHAEPLTPAAFAPFGRVVQNPATHDGEPPLNKVMANQGSAIKWERVTSTIDWYPYIQGSRPKLTWSMFVCSPRKLVKREEKEVFEVNVLERHPHTSQTFVPMGLSAEDRGTCYLVIVAPTLSPAPKPTSESIINILDFAYPARPPRRRRSLKERLLGARPNPFTNDHNVSTTPSGQLPSEPESKPKGRGPPDLARMRAFVARGDQAVTYEAGTWHAPMVVLGKKSLEFVVVQYMSGVANEDCQETNVPANDGAEGIAVDVSGLVEGVLSFRSRL